MSDTRQQVLAAIATVDDGAHKTILLLLLQVMEEIGSKIDKVFADEPRIKAIALNGHAADFDILCGWVRRKIREEEVNTTSFRKIRDGMIEKVLWAGLSSVTTITTLGILGYLRM